jgi:hypothetical protein
LPTGTYVAVASARGYIRERYADTTCFPTCVITTGTPIPVTLGVATPHIDFALARGGGISGRVTEGLYPLPGVEVSVYTSDHVLVTSSLTDAVGQYVTEEGLAPGSYRLKTTNLVGRVDEVWDNVPCVTTVATCGGTLVPIGATETVANRDFALAAGARVSGRVTDEETGAPLAQVGIVIVTSTGAQVGGPSLDPAVVRVNALTDADGRYTITTGLPAGSYFLMTVSQGSYVDERNDGGVCVQARCDLTYQSTPVAVGSGATTTVDFALKRGGGLAGAVLGSDGKPLTGVGVEIFAETGKALGQVRTNAAGRYTLEGGLLPGSYYVRTQNAHGYVDEVFDNLLCVGCPVTGATKVPVTPGVTTTGVDFELVQGGLVTGTIYDRIRRTPLVNHPVSLLEKHVTGPRVVARTRTDRDGVYAVGLPKGNYFAQSDGKDGYQITLYGPGGGVPRYRRNLEGVLEDFCPAGLCNPEFGTEIPLDIGDIEPQIDIGVRSCSGLALTVSPSLAGVPFGTPLPLTTFTLTGGPTPHGFLVTSGQLPPGLTLDSATGVLAGTPTAAGTTAFEITGVDGEGCSASRTFTPTFCGYAVPSSGVVGPAAGTGSFPVNLAAAGCSAATMATPTSSAPWLTITSAPTTPVASALIGYSYQARGNVSASRTATISAAGHTFTLTQLGTPAVVTATAAGGGVLGPGSYSTETIVVTTNTVDAAWSATVDRPWLALAPASGVGSGSIAVSVQRNATPFARQATVTIAGVAIPIVQRANGVPGPPTNLDAIVATGTARFVWLPPQTGGDATSYELVAGGAPGQTLVGPFPMTAPPYTVPNVPSGRFYVRVRARNEFGLSGDSNEHILVMNGPCALPGPPVSLTHTFDATTRRLTLTWGAPGTGCPATSYLVEAGTTTGGTNIAQFPHGSTSFTHAPVPDGLYYLRVRGVNAVGAGLVPSNEVKLNVGNVPEPPNAPQNFAASVSGSTVTFSWTPPAATGNNAATSYVIEAGSAPGLANLATLPVTGTSRSVPGVPPGTYFVRIRARNSAGDSSASNEVTVTVR